MLSLEEWMDVKELHRQGHSIRAIADLTGYARNTVRRVLREAVPTPAGRRPRPSRLDPFKPYILAREETCRLSAVRLLEELRPQGYVGGIDVVRRYLRRIRADRRARARMTVRFETPPGHQAQVDWAAVGAFPDAVGNRLAIYCFVMVLGFSRQLYLEFTTDMTLPTLIRCHLNAFTYYQGAPRSLLYDNMKQVRLGPHEWNPLFLDFCGHYGLAPKTHRVRRPRTKGKVERAVAYIQDAFLNGRTFADLDDLNAQGRAWLEAVANVRVHATTGARPVDLWRQEQPLLIALAGIPPYQVWERHPRKVDAEGRVHLGRSRYSVPPEYIGKAVIVVRQPQRVVIRCGEGVIAEHDPAPTPGACMTDPAHLAALARLSLARSAPPPPAAVVARAVTVATTPLAVYEEAAR